jgi:hypothetical protein
VPPSTGWITVSPGYGPTAGCGHEPPPSHVASGALEVTEGTNTSVCMSTKRDITGIGCGAIFPRYISVNGAGSNVANGIYKYEGEVASRPFFRNTSAGSKTALWYFATCPLNRSTGGVISYNGWYISLDVETSSYAAAGDMYCCYSSSSTPPLSDWVVREPGIGPLAGCGKLPVPVMRGANDDVPSDSSDAAIAVDGKLLMLFRVMVPDGTMITLPVSEKSTIEDVMVQVDAKNNSLRVYDMVFKQGGAIINPKSSVFESVREHDIIIAEARLSRPPSAVVQPAKRVLVIGAGPVGMPRREPL